MLAAATRRLHPEPSDDSAEKGGDSDHWGR